MIRAFNRNVELSGNFRCKGMRPCRGVNAKRQERKQKPTARRRSSCNGGNAAVAPERAAAHGKSAARYKRRFEKRRKLEKLSARRDHTQARTGRDPLATSEGSSGIVNETRSKQALARRNNNGRKGPNPLTRSFESNVRRQDSRHRATCRREISTARPRRANLRRYCHGENLLQHAEHYFRLIAAAQQQSTNAYGRQTFERRTTSRTTTTISRAFRPVRAAGRAPAPRAARFSAPPTYSGPQPQVQPHFAQPQRLKNGPSPINRATNVRIARSGRRSADVRTQPGSRRIGPRPGSWARPQCRARRRDERARSSHGVRAQPRP